MAFNKGNLTNSSFLTVMVFVLLLSMLSCFSTAMYTSSDPITKLTDSNFDSLVLSSKNIWVVEFYADYCGHCKNFASEYIKAAKSLEGIVSFGVVDAQTNQQLASRYGVQGLPTVKIFGTNKKSPIDYNNERTSRALSGAVFKEIRNIVTSRLDGGASSSKPTNKPSSSSSNKANVVTLTDSTFNQVTSSDKIWFVAFTASWCGHCKRALPHFTSAASKLSEQDRQVIQFANIDCPTHGQACQRYGVSGYPTFKLFVNGKPQDYNGGREENDFLMFARNKAQSAANRPAPKPKELVDNTVLNECLNEQVCIFASLPQVEENNKNDVEENNKNDVEERKKYIKILENAAKLTKQFNIKWVYSYARVHADFENALNLGQNGFPAIGLISSKKKVYSHLYRAFTEENIVSWAKSAGVGRVASAINYQSLPAIKNVPKWDNQTNNVEKQTIYKDEL